MLHLYSFASNIKVFFRYLVAYKMPLLLDTSHSSRATSDTIIENQIALVGVCTNKPSYKVYRLLSRMAVIPIVLFIHSDYTCRVLFISNLCFGNCKTTIAPILCTSYPISSSFCDDISSSFFLLPPFVILQYTPPLLLCLCHFLRCHVYD